MGGTAAVFGCHDQILDLQVALKLYRSGLSEEAQQRIRRELRLARQLSHPNIIRYCDMDIHAGRPFITLELLERQDLGHHIDAGPLPMAVVLDYVTQACVGLQHAHDRDITHRDIKPENLFLSTDGIVHVMDLGLAKQLSATGFTARGTVAGTIGYMSPDQLVDLSSVTHLTDIYAMGILAYELLTGALPFEHDDARAIARMHHLCIPSPPSDHRPELPKALDTVVLRALAEEPSQRYQSCADFARALTNATRG